MNVDVQISEIAYRKIMHWIRKAGKYEISGFGNVVYDEEAQTFLVTDAYLLEQENTGVTTDINDNAVGKLMYEHHKSKVKGELRFWWHSHAWMDVFWSGTDLETIEKLGKGGWFLNTVFNLKEEMRSAVYTTQPIPAFEDELPTTVLYSLDEKVVNKIMAKLGFKVKKDNFSNFLWSLEPTVEKDEIKAWDKEYDDKVSIKKPTPTGVRIPGVPSHLPLGDDSDDEFSGFPHPGMYGGLLDTRGGIKSYEDLDEEEIDDIMTEMEEWIAMHPGCSAKDVIEEFESEYPFISMLIPFKLKEQ